MIEPYDVRKFKEMDNEIRRLRRLLKQHQCRFKFTGDCACWFRIFHGKKCTATMELAK